MIIPCWSGEQELPTAVACCTELPIPSPKLTWKLIEGRIWLIPQIGGPSLRCQHNKSPTIWGLYWGGPLIVGNCHIGYTILYYTILYYTILYYTILYYTILYYTILYYTILYYTILYYTILYPPSKIIMEAHRRPHIEDTGLVRGASKSPA